MYIYYIYIYIYIAIFKGCYMEIPLYGDSKFSKTPGLVFLILIGNRC